MTQRFRTVSVARRWPPRSSLGDRRRRRRLVPDPGSAGRRRHRRAAQDGGRPRRGRHDRRRREARAAPRRARRGRARPRARARLHRRPQPLDRGARDAAARRDAGVAGHHDGRRGPGRRVRVADRRLPPQAPLRAAGGQRSDDGRPRDDPRDGHGQGFPPPRHGRRDRENGRARRSGDARGRRRALLGPRVRRRQLQRDEGARGDVGGRRPTRRLLHDARPRRGRQGLLGVRGSDPHRPRGEAPGRDLAHQARHGRRLGEGEGGRRALRPRARRGAGRHGGLLSLRGVALQHGSSRPQQEVRRPDERREGPRRRRPAPTTSRSRTARSTPSTTAGRSRRSRSPRASRRCSSTSA